jgi:LPXTG-site transpeptidase (sortase) family protein
MARVRTVGWRSALTVAIALILAIDGVAVVASDASTGSADVSAIGAAAGRAALPELGRVRTLGSLAMAAVDPVLPQPENAPDNPHAPTPEVQLGVLELPTIGVSQSLFEGVTLTAIDRGPSHWPGTAMPGELGNVVVAGHRITHSHPFFDLDLLTPGDPLIFTTAAGRFTYRLTSTEIVPFTEVRVVDQVYGFTATLFGCHPKGSARFRIVGHFELETAEPASPAPS